MAEERKTSFAKDVDGLHKEESALDRARALRDQFAHAQEQNNNKEQNRQGERLQGETEKSGSQMVRQDAPGMHLRPGGAARAGQADFLKARSRKNTRRKTRRTRPRRSPTISRRSKARPTTATTSGSLSVGSGRAGCIPGRLSGRDQHGKMLCRPG